MFGDNPIDLGKPTPTTPDFRTDAFHELAAKQQVELDDDSPVTSGTCHFEHVGKPWLGHGDETDFRGDPALCLSQCAESPQFSLRLLIAIASTNDDQQRLSAGANGRIDHRLIESLGRQTKNRFVTAQGLRELKLQIAEGLRRLGHLAGNIGSGVSGLEQQQWSDGQTTRAALHQRVHRITNRGTGEFQKAMCDRCIWQSMGDAMGRLDQLSLTACVARPVADQQQPVMLVGNRIRSSRVQGGPSSEKSHAQECRSEVNPLADRQDDVAEVARMPTTPDSVAAGILGLAPEWSNVRSSSKRCRALLAVVPGLGGALLY